jgi:hypothetical protein
MAYPLAHSRDLSNRTGLEVIHSSENVPTSSQCGNEVRLKDYVCGFVCHLLSRNGVIAIAVAISPYREARAAVGKRIDRFVEVYVRCPLEATLPGTSKECIRRL